MAHLFIYTAGEMDRFGKEKKSELLLRNPLTPLHGSSLTLKGKEIKPSSVDLSSLAPHVSLI